MQDSHPTLKTWYHLYISDPFWWSTKYVDCFILLSLEYTEKWTIFFECQGKMFISIEKVLEKISENQP